MSKNAVDSANGKAVSRRTILTGAAASLPAVPAFALPALAATDDPLEDLLACAEASGISLDLLHAATCTLDRDARRSVLASITMFAKKYEVKVMRRDQSTRDRLCGAFEEMAVIAKRLADEVGQLGWSVSGRDSKDGGFSFDATITEPVRTYDPETRIAWNKGKFHLRLAYRDGELIDETEWLLSGMPRNRRGAV